MYQLSYFTVTTTAKWVLDMAFVERLEGVDTHDICDLGTIEIC